MNKMRSIFRRAFWMGFAWVVVLGPSALAMPADSSAGTDALVINTQAPSPTFDIAMIALGACLAVVAALAVRYTVKGVSSYRDHHSGHHAPA